MMRKALVAAVVFGMSATAAPALAAQSDNNQAGANRDDMEQVICQRESMIGSRVAKRRVCMTRREWIRTQNATRDGLNDHLRAATGGAGRE
jgi:hypothetical protein